MLLAQNNGYKVVLRYSHITHGISPKRYTSIAKIRTASEAKMPVVIQPNILLDADNVPVERELYDKYVANTLDAKNMLIIGHMAVMASTRHLQLDREAKDLTAFQARYDKLIDDMKREYQEKAENMAARIINDKDKDIALIQERLTSTRETALTEKEHEIRMLRQQLHNANQMQDAAVAMALFDKEKENAQLKEQVSVLSLTKRNENDSKIAALQEHINVLQKTLAESRESSNAAQANLIKSFRDDEIASLQSQIASLKGSNFSKGVVGENSVRKWLMNAFPDCEIADKSGIASESDLHIIKPNGEFIAVECKNKNIITVQDVDKSVRDIHYLRDRYGDKFVGYIFISLRSMNIPKKGCGNLETHTDSYVPVYWYGQMDFDEDDNNAVSFVNALWTIAGTLKNFRSKFRDMDSNNTDYQRKIDEMLGCFKNSLDKLNANQKSVASLIQTARAIQDNNNSVIQAIGNIMSNAIEDHHNLHVGDLSSFVEQHACDNCKRTFTRKSDLTRHVKKCVMG